jgi:hypothetical protein
LSNEEENVIFVANAPTEKLEFMNEWYDVKREVRKKSRRLKEGMLGTMKRIADQPSFEISKHAPKNKQLTL